MSVPDTLPQLLNEKDRSPTVRPENDRWTFSRDLVDESLSTVSPQDEMEFDTQFNQSDLLTVQAIDKQVGWIDVRGSRKILDQQWECVIVSQDDETVHCELHDLSDPTMEAEYAEVYLTEFSEYDRPRLTEGTVFYWSIGRERKEHGQITKFSELRLRPTPRISRAALRRITERAKKLDGVFQRAQSGQSACQ